MSKKQSHTPGPWELVEDTSIYDERAFSIETIVNVGFEIDPQRNTEATLQVALVTIPSDAPDSIAEQQTANATLISAAPEMLEALELILHYVNEGDETLASVLVDEIKSTIAKARGET